MIVKLLTEHHLGFLSLSGGCRGSFKSTHVKMLHCWKSRALANMFLFCQSILLSINFASCVLCILTKFRHF